VGGTERGYDGGKKVKGRKRHLLVDTQGLVLKVKVLAANRADSLKEQNYCSMASNLSFPAESICGSMVGIAPRLSVGSRSSWGGVKERVQHPFAGSRRRITAPGVEPTPIDRSFKVIPRRWVVERTYGWLGRYRRLSKDYEHLPETSAAFIYSTSLRTLLRRLA